MSSLHTGTAGASNAMQQNHVGGGLSNVSVGSNVSSPVRIKQSPTAEEEFSVNYASPQRKRDFEKFRQWSDHTCKVQEVLFYVKKVPTIVSDTNWLSGVFQGIINSCYIGTDDSVGLSVTNTYPNNKSSVVFGMRRKRHLQIDDIVNRFQAHCEDDPKFRSCGPFCVKLQIVRWNEDRLGWSSESEFNDYCKEKKSIIVAACISVADNIAQAIAHAIASLQNNKSDFKKLYNEGQLLAAVLIDQDENRTNMMSVLRVFEKYHSDKYNITLYCDPNGRDILFESASPPRPGRPTINLLTMSENEYAPCNAIRSLRAAFCFGRSVFCHHCRKSYLTEHDHVCLDVCRCCRQQHVCLPDGKGERKCKDCGRTFVSESCLKRHHEITFGKKSTCQKLKICQICLLEYAVCPSRGKHQCGKIYCVNCRAQQLKNHKCQSRPTITPQVIGREKRSIDEVDAGIQARKVIRTKEPFTVAEHISTAKKVLAASENSAGVENRQTESFKKKSSVPLPPQPSTSAKQPQNRPDNKQAAQKRSTKIQPIKNNSTCESWKDIQTTPKKQIINSDLTFVRPLAPLKISQIDAARPVVQSDRRTQGYKLQSPSSVRPAMPSSNNTGNQRLSTAKITGSQVPLIGPSSALPYQQAQQSVEKNPRSLTTSSSSDLLPTSSKKAGLPTDHRAQPSTSRVEIPADPMGAKKRVSVTGYIEIRDGEIEGLYLQRQN